MSLSPRSAVLAAIPSLNSSGSGSASSRITSNRSSDLGRYCWGVLTILAALKPSTTRGWIRRELLAGAAAWAARRGARRDRRDTRDDARRVAAAASARPADEAKAPMRGPRRAAPEKCDGATTRRNSKRSIVNSNRKRRVEAASRASSGPARRSGTRHGADGAPSPSRSGPLVPRRIDRVRDRGRGADPCGVLRRARGGLSLGNTYLQLPWRNCQGILAVSLSLQESTFGLCLSLLRPKAVRVLPCMDKSLNQLAQEDGDNGPQRSRPPARERIGSRSRGGHAPIISVNPPSPCVPSCAATNLPR